MIIAFGFPARGRAGHNQRRPPCYTILVRNAPVNHKQSRGVGRLLKTSVYQLLKLFGPLTNLIKHLSGFYYLAGDIQSG